MPQTDRVAIVTGASRGIGRAIALELAAQGCDIVLNYARRADSAAEVVEAIEAGGRRAVAVQANIGEPAAAQALCDAALSAFGRIDIVVNNAGVSSNETFIADTPESVWRAMLTTNLDGVYHMVRAVVPHMRARRSGHIVNLSSNVTQRMPATFGPYTISKVAVEALTRILAKEEGPHGIRVNAVAPGPIMTEMLAGLLEHMGADKAEAFVRSVPLGRTGEPREIAAIVAMLVSDVASYVTGQVVYVNGGGPGG
ncbi:MAG: 3-oxoacyl-ACP reductase FabG [Gammaproteobacteria bacterium]|nr:3-oxoacyl-ACP reductase FabG [Gammaproteobacteria bacterium]MCP5201031.1 3-oxoacyl-ACP reductase FabG [Gammaproteobacteria bacterium]